MQKYFQYRKTTESEWQETAKQDVTESQAFDATVEGLDAGEEYEFRAVLEWDEGQQVEYGDTETFYLAVPQAEATSEGFAPADIEPAFRMFVYFEYREDGETGWQETDWIEVFESGELEAEKEGLSVGTVHEFRAVIDVGGNKYYGETETFETDDQVDIDVSAPQAESDALAPAPEIAEFPVYLEAVAAEADGEGRLPEIKPAIRTQRWFEYKQAGEADWIATDKVEVEESQEYDLVLEGLQEAGNYEYRAVADRGGTTVYGEVLTFQTEGAEEVEISAVVAESDAVGVAPEEVKTEGVMVRPETALSGTEAFVPSIIGQRGEHITDIPPPNTDADSPAPETYYSIGAGIVDSQAEALDAIVQAHYSVIEAPQAEADSDTLPAGIDNAAMIPAGTAEADGNAVDADSMEPAMPQGVYFEYREVTDPESEWQETSPRVVKQASTEFEFALDGLEGIKQYEFRAVIRHGATDLYGDTLTFQTPVSPPVSGADSEAFALESIYTEYPAIIEPPAAEAIPDGITPEVYTEHPKIIDFPQAEADADGIVPAEVLDERNLQLQRVDEGVIRLRWHHIPVWAGIVDYSVLWLHRNLHVTLTYRRDLTDDISSLQIQQFRLEKPGGGDVFPDEAVLDEDEENRLTLIFEDYYVYMPETVHDQWKAETQGEALIPTITPETEADKIPGLAEASGAGTAPAVSGVYNMTLSYQQSTNPDLRLKDFYGDDVDHPDSITIAVPEESYEVRFTVRLEVV